MSTSKLLKLPYLERQNIVVVPDDVAEELQEIVPTGDDVSVWKRLWPLKPDDEQEVRQPLPDYIDRLLNAQTQFRKEGHELLIVTDDQATDLDFDAPGHPVREVVYVGHPMAPNKYYPVAVFNRELLEDRYCELFRLLAHLGATKIRVEAHGATSRGFRFAISGLSIGDSSADAGKSKSENTVWEASLDGGDPILPDDLLWYRYEKTWQTIAEARLKFGLRTFDVSIDQKEDFGVDAGFSGVVRGVKFKLGGEYSDVSTVSLRLSGEFASRPEPNVSLTERPPVAVPE